MELLDNISRMVGISINYAGKKAEIVKLQTDLTDTSRSLEFAYAALGRAVVMREGANESFLAMYGQQLSAVHELECRVAETQERIEGLSQTQLVYAASAKTVTKGRCPTCGASVPIDAMFCSSCGRNLATLKANFVKCLSCGAIYDSDAVFCIECGSRLEPPLVADSKSSQIQSEQLTMIDRTQVPEQEPSVHSSYEPPSVVACSNCGESVDVNDLFCGLCGIRLK